MKFMAIILSVLTIMSSVFSFGDEFFVDSNQMFSEVHSDTLETMHIDHQEKPAITHDNDHHDKNQSDDSNCDDECHFCITACMSINILPSIFHLDVKDFEILNSKVNTNYSFSYSNKYLERIFQPPQV